MLSEECLDVVAKVPISAARIRVLDDWVALSKQLWESFTELLAVHAQLCAMLVCMARNPSCPGQLRVDVCSQIDALCKQLDSIEPQVYAAGRLH